MGLIRHSDFIYLVLKGLVWLTFSITDNQNTHTIGPAFTAIYLSCKTTKIHAISLSTAFQFSYIHAFPTSELQAVCHSACGVPGLPLRGASPPPELREKMRFISGIQTHPMLCNRNTWRDQSHIWGHQRGCESPQKRLRNLPKASQEIYGRRENASYFPSTSASPKMG